MSTSSRPFTFDRVVRIIIAISLIAGAVWMVNILSNVLLPFCLACLIAYILEPFMEFNRRLLHLKGRVAATFITLFEVLFFMAVLCYFFVPSVIREIHLMENMIKEHSGSIGDADILPKVVYDYLANLFNTGHLRQLLDGQHIGVLLNKGTSLISQSFDLVLHTLEWFLTFIYVIFIMIDYRRIMRGFRLLVPPKYRPIAYRVGDDIKLSMNRYFRGQAVLALCAAVFYCIGFSIVGIPLAIMLGVLVGMLYMIPYFQYITLIPVAAVCFISTMDNPGAFWPIMGKCVGVYVISQCICDYILTPKIMGKALGLNPALILLSLSVWGTLLGLIGMIIALPLTTLMLAYYDEYVIKRGDLDSQTIP